MGVRSRSVRSITVLEVSGKFFGDEETDQLKKAIADAAASGNSRLVLDMSECNMMNSTVLTVLVNAHKNYDARQGMIKICGLQQRMENMLVMTRLINVFGHYPTVGEAIASFAETPTGAA